MDVSKSLLSNDDDAPLLQCRVKGKRPRIESDAAYGNKRQKIQSKRQHCRVLYLESGLISDGELEKEKKRAKMQTLQ